VLFIIIVGVVRPITDYAGCAVRAPRCDVGDGQTPQTGARLPRSISVYCCARDSLSVTSYFNQARAQLANFTIGIYYFI
jgi:hypothetical protein